VGKIQSVVHKVGIGVKIIIIIIISEMGGLGEGVGGINDENIF
jgi:hypothetical protein